ncbi:putative PEP-binding protein [Paenibacillus sp. QZ-Y1]|uniref:putative PEP-binding protein n=1 Tax=Paenibacillus sp. QZ-Y1 TaxID=3414511 RepID=UPI003F7A55A2
MTKRVILLEEGTAEMKGLMGSTGAELAELLHAGWSVPAGFVVTTECCREFCTRLGHLSAEGVEEIGSAIRHLEQQTGKYFDHSENPLLLAVRSDGASSIQTVKKLLLHVGLNDITVEGLARQTKDRKYALNCYRMLLQDYGQLVHGIAYECFEERVGDSTILDEAKLEMAIAEYKRLIEERGRKPFPQDTQLQLQEVIRAVFNSQCVPMSREQADVYRKSHYGAAKQGSPVLIQAMVNGECGERSGIGTIYSRHPVTGEQGITGEYISSAASRNVDRGLEQLLNEAPELYGLLLEVSSQLEKRRGAVQEIKFVVDSGTLYLMQAGQARLTSIATLKSAVDLVHEGVITHEDALLRIEPGHVTEVANSWTEQTTPLSPELQLLLEWADEVKELTVLANVDHPRDAITARALGAEGIGLCRTEQMLLSPSRLPYVQKMILADSESERKRGLERLLPMQQSDFEQLFEAMDGFPVTIRLLDLTLHDLLPDLEVLEERYEQLRIGGVVGNKSELEELERVIRRVLELHERIPMLGQRGCRLGIMFPEIVDMQLEAVFRAAVRGIRQGWWVRPEIMIPQVDHASEIQTMRDLVDHVADQVLGEEKRHCLYRVGAMIEAPRGALTAAHIARHADFLSFDTDDLTQMTFGYSRHDAEKQFLHPDVERRLLPSNPFEVLDIEGVGQLVEMAVTQGRIRKPHLKAGICGENAADPDSIAFCHQINLAYVSCLPEQVPFARIAAAQAVIRAQRQGVNILNGEISTTA